MAVEPARPIQPPSPEPCELEVEYPERDGRPMGETEVHIQCLIDTREALRAYFRDDPNVYVGANLLLYYERGQPFLVVSPDVFVTRGIPKLPQRRTYKLWEEGRPPSFILEITSRGTRREDRVVKKALYESLGVREYFLFDPLGEYLKPPLQAYELVRGRYRRKAVTETGGIFSDQLGLELRPEGTRLRFYDPVSGERLLTPEEEAERRRAAEARAAAAEAELAQLRAQLERLRRPGEG